MHDPPQLMLPVGHDTTQLPPLHTVPPVHLTPHPPQLFASLLVVVHPALQFVCPFGQQALLVSVWPLGQAQPPAWQVSPPPQVAPWLLPDVLVQLPLAPQYVPSVFGLMHDPPQLISGDWQLS
jgi:hypothetical protein